MVVRWKKSKALKKLQMPIGIDFAPTYLPTYLQVQGCPSKKKTRLHLEEIFPKKTLFHIGFGAFSKTSSYLTAK